MNPNKPSTNEVEANNIPPQFQNNNSFQLQVILLESEPNLPLEEKEKRRKIISSKINKELEKVNNEIEGLVRTLAPFKDQIQKYKSEIDKEYERFINTDETIPGLSEIELFYLNIMRGKFTNTSKEHKYLGLRISYLILLRCIYKYVLNSSSEDSKNNSEAQVREVMLKLAREKYDEVYFKRRGRISDDMFAISKGVNPDNEETTLFYELAGEIGEHFDAHGISKTEQFDNLITLLSNGIDKSRKFYTAPFSIGKDKVGVGAGMGTSSGEAYKEGLAIVVSGYNETLSQDGIKIVFINDVFSGLEKILKGTFPEYEFYLLSQQKEVLENKEREYNNK